VNARRIVVTGMGLRTCNADSPESYADALSAGRSGVRDITAFDTGWPFRQGGEVTLAPEEEEPGLDRVSQLAIAAARQAAADSGLSQAALATARAGLCLGTSRGPALSLERLLRLGDAQDKQALFAEVPFSSIARNVARRLGLSGPIATVTMACVSSSLAIGRAWDMVRRGQSDVMVAGGADSLTRFSFSGFSVLRAMTKSSCRPFDRRRDGMILGEGAGFLVLEDFDHARRRGARVYAEICGWGTAGDAHHATSPHPQGRGLANAMRAALRQAQLSVDAIDHANLHGTGTQANDPAECQAVRQVFGEAASRLPVNSLKPMIGHTLGAAGVLELAGSILGMRGGFVPPTLNYDEPDPSCALNVVGREPREQPIDVLLSTKSAFGGANVAIVARRV
jgi:3-oxoacyl-[acyl-carrier-protein] synthase II